MGSRSHVVERLFMRVLHHRPGVHDLGFVADNDWPHCGGWHLLHDHSSDVTLLPTAERDVVAAT